VCPGGFDDDADVLVFNEVVVAHRFPPGDGKPVMTSINAQRIARLDKNGKNLIGIHPETRAPLLHGPLLMRAQR
jgi:hypothetical protein